MKAAILVTIFLALANGLFEREKGLNDWRIENLG
jgi:hypothetical protein